MSKKLHILFLSSWYPSRAFPINGDFVQRHAEAVAIKNRVTLIHVVTDKNSASIEHTESTINNVKTIIVYLPQKKSLLKSYYFYKMYVSTIKKIGAFDLAHLNVAYPKGMIALYLKFCKKKPYIISEHWTGYGNPLTKSIGFLQKIITKLIVKNATFVCPVSNQLQNDMINFGLKGNYKPVPNVVNTDLFFPVKKTSKTITIVHVSSFNNEQKNITGILNTVKKLSEKRTDFIFKIVGNGNTKVVQNYIDNLQIPSKNIQLIGTKTQEEIAAILQEGSLYISFSNYETFGIVMAEAIATGMPVISTNTGFLTELNASEYTSIIPIKDEKILLETMLKYMDSTKVYDVKKMHDLMKQNFSFTKICDSFTNLYLEAQKI